MIYSGHEVCVDQKEIGVGQQDERLELFVAAPIHVLFLAVLCQLWSNTLMVLKPFKEGRLAAQILKMHFQVYKLICGVIMIPKLSECFKSPQLILEYHSIL